jgi:hypothetical protein
MKTYQKPKTNIVNVKPTLMSASNPYTGTVEEGFNLGIVESTTLTDGNLSRNVTVWDFDDEE